MHPCYRTTISTIHCQNLSSSSAETLYTLNTNRPFSPLLAPGNHHSTFLFYEFDYSWYQY